MSTKLSGLKNTKSRTLLILGVVIFIIIAVVIYFVTKKSTVVESQQSKTAKLPDIASVPGGVTSEKYQQLQEIENKKRAEAAKQAGTSAVATIIGTRGKDSLSGKETFGIEDQFLKAGGCKCPPGGAIDPALAAKLIDEIEKDPSKALELLRQNPGLAKALCQQKQATALKVASENKEVAKIILNECPELAKPLATKNPELFKEIMIENPELAKTLAEKDPALFKNLMEQDSNFARQLAKSNPELVKNLIKNDAAFGQKMAKANPDMIRDLMKDDPEFAKVMAENPYILAEKFREQQQKALKEAGQRGVQLSELQQKQLQSLIAAMEGQAKPVFQAWNEVSGQQFIQGEWAKKEEEEKEKKASEKTTITTETVIPPGQPGPAGVFVKAGTILFAVLDTAVNSDYPGPVLATIVGGPYKGAKVLGTMSTVPFPGNSGSPEKLTLNFNLMNVPNAPSSIPIQAVAIDPDTARTALASNVNRHFLYRYGSLFASALMTGYSKVITSQGTVQETSTNGQSVRTQSKDLNSSEKFYAALGDVGKKLGEAVAPNVNRPYTITVKSGIGLGLLFLADVSG